MIKQSINRGRGTQPKVDRNMRIARAYQQNVDVVEIAHEHGLSVTRIYAVLNQLGIPKHKS
jgi:hypothetical protein